MFVGAAAAIIALYPLPVGAGSNDHFSLKSGEAVFWNGPFIESGSNQAAGQYVISVKEKAKRLRLGIDHPEIGDVFVVEVLPPKGEEVSFTTGAGLYSAETLITRPPVGDWKVRVIATQVTESAYRMRAKLEGKLPSTGPKTEPVLPNLQILPPHAASFLLPVTNGATDETPTGLDTGGLISCHPEEYAEDHAVRCLRFGYGIRNTGLGPLDLFTEGENPLERPLIQRVYRADETYFDRSAGLAQYHKTHGHFHHGHAVALQLFRVEDEKTGELSPAGDERTKGFAHRNELLRDWDRFYPTLPMSGFGLLAGYSDIYEWDRPGNYIDFHTNGDGLYVLRMRADPVDGILEINERDNAGYTYFEVAGSQVTLIEAGRGRDPWDRCKILVGFGGHPDPTNDRKRPLDCPPDTT